AEQRFQEALDFQNDQARRREWMIIGTGMLLLAVGGIGVFVFRRRVPVISVGKEVGRGERSNTEMHKLQNLSEYVLDGRDEDGIRYLLRISGDQLTTEEGVVIGRNPKDSPYIINHADVSRKHARIKVMKNRIFIEDLGSTNGTSVNGQSIDDKGPVSVNDGDQIIIGSVVMKLRVLAA
ncbi:MAG: FHA domain-containing protein, partial [Pseudomonadales bacterium]|nr:FHA domain-containing protein [Pseudomonadales bacterium]